MLNGLRYEASIEEVSQFKERFLAVELRLGRMRQSARYFCIEWRAGDAKCARSLGVLPECRALSQYQYPYKRVNRRGPTIHFELSPNDRAGNDRLVVCLFPAGSDSCYSYMLGTSPALCIPHVGS